MTKVKDQLAAFGEILEERYLPISHDRVEASVEIHQPARRVSRVFVFVAAAGVVLVLGVLTSLVLNQDIPAATDPSLVTSPTTPPIDTEFPAQGPELVDAPYVGLETSLGTLIWNKYEGRSGGIPSVQSDIDGYVMVAVGPLKFSDNGIEWTTTPSDTGLDGYSFFRSSGLWALAGDSMWNNGGETRDLLQSDGSTWVKVDLSGSDNPWPEMPVISGDHVIVTDARNDGAYWLSTDGGPFVQRPVPWQFSELPQEAYKRVSIMAAPSGGFVAHVGLNGGFPDGSDLIVAEAWTSADGRTWTNQGTPDMVEPSIDRRHLVHVELDRNELLMTLYEVDGGAVLGTYVSVDGITWIETTRRPSGAKTTTRPSQAEWPGVQNGDFGFVDSEDVPSPESQRVWISADGTHWEETQPPPSQPLGSFYAIGDLIYTGNGETPTATLWIAHFES